MQTARERHGRYEQWTQRNRRSSSTRYSTPHCPDSVPATRLRPRGRSKYCGPPCHPRADGAGPLRILEIGCGNGAATIPLARHTGESILAMDNHQPFLDELQRRAATTGVAAQIQVSLRDMHTLGQDDGVFDLIWSEGALFIMGFRKGLTAWHALLTPGGGLAVSELAWLRSDPPAECRPVLRRHLSCHDRRRDQPGHDRGLRIRGRRPLSPSRKRPGGSRSITRSKSAYAPCGSGTATIQRDGR